MADRSLSTVSKILLYQVLIIVMMAAGFAAAVGKMAALSTALGGAAAFFPNLFFAYRIKKATGQEARKIVVSFYTGEVGKLLLTAAIFVLIFQIPKIDLLPLLVGYLTALSVFWFALLMR
ncbi:ATP synthase subunit I [Methylomicrobium sp. RS1]|uniref:ATP synthase subunit I n=1 Tax=Candidatus Methylomicrobium oryzae TaxID=2802053 RepID=UPI0019229E97|nr:ATP synthase subunit I [Methylomicrobium sp. RS1]